MAMASDPRKEYVVRVGTISVNNQFWYCDEKYVRIPEMILECGDHGFMVNSMRVEDSTDLYSPPTIIADYFHPDTLVELVQE